MAYIHTKMFRTVTSAISGAAVLALPSFVGAQTGATLVNPIKYNSVGGLIQGFVEIFSYLVILFAVLAIVWVGFQFILARGNSERLKELKTWLLYIVIGVAIVIGARIIVTVVINTLSASGVVNSNVIQSAQDAARGN